MFGNSGIWRFPILLSRFLCVLSKARQTMRSRAICMWIYLRLSQMSSFASLHECTYAVLLQVSVGLHEKSLCSETRFNFSSNAALSTLCVLAIHSCLWLSWHSSLHSHALSWIKEHLWMKSNTVKRGTSGLCGVFRWFLFLFFGLVQCNHAKAISEWHNSWKCCWFVHYSCWRNACEAIAWDGHEWDKKVLWMRKK